MEDDQKRERRLWKEEIKDDISRMEIKATWRMKYRKVAGYK